jgi:flagellin-specific chaperone FliS
MDKGENIVTLEDLLDRFNARTKKFIKELEYEEETERVETLDSIINEIKGQINYTKTQRARFINESLDFKHNDIFEVEIGGLLVKFIKN